MTETNRVRLLTVAAPVLVGVLVCAVVVLLAGVDPDGQLFERAGRLLLSSRGLDVFADSELQVGPLYLLLLGVGSRLGHLLHLPAGGVALAGVTAVLLAAVTLVPAAAARDRMAAALAIAVAGPLSVAVLDGHLEELFVPILLLAAAAAALRDRSLLAGALLAGATGLKLWGVVGLPVLLFLVGRRRQLLAGAVAVGGALVLYLPFVVLGEVNTFEHSWPVGANTLVSLLFGRPEHLGWPGRALQAAVALAAGVAAVRRCDRETAFWAVPVVIVCARLVADPVNLAYYWAAPTALLFVGVWTSQLAEDAKLQACLVLMLAFGLLVLTGNYVLLVVVLLTTTGAVLLAVTGRIDRLVLLHPTDRSRPDADL